MPNPPNNLKTPGATATSELRASYDDLRRFLTLRSSDELFGVSTKPGPPTPDTNAQKSDEQSNKSTAISTLLSPDGAFFTVDLFDRGLIKQIGLEPDVLDPKKPGDINIYGAKDLTVNVNGTTISYSNGKTIKEKLGIVPDKTTIAEKDTTGSITAEIDRLDKEIKNVNDEIKDLKADKEKALVEFPIGLPVGERGAWIATKHQEIDANIAGKEKSIGELSAQKASENARLEARKISDLKTDLIFTGINSTPTQPAAPKAPHVSLYRHVNKFLDISSAASDYCNVFFNSIDSINMSLCVPYFRLNIIDRFSKKKGRYSKLSLAAFLKQSQGLDSDKIFYNAEPVLFDTSVQSSKTLKSGKVVGLETFYAPQTLLPDPTEVLSNPRRLDTSVPLISLNSFSVSIESVGIALMSKKTADLSITLHDRSRLADISPLVSVGNFSSLYFEIEWGWVHPHAAPEFNNPVARYLNALRFREIFAPTTYNMSMQDGGAMTINLRLIGGASVDAVNGSVLNGGFVSRSFATDLFNRLIKSSIEDEDRENATVDIKPVTSLLIDKSRTAQIIDREFIDRMWDYSTDEASETDTKRKELLEKLIDILKTRPYFKNDDIIEKLRLTLRNVSMTGFDTEFDRLGLSSFGTTSQEYTTVAAYLTMLVGMPLAATGLYDEVQLHTFKFNDAAGKMAGRQICDTPIRLLDVLKRPDMAGSINENSSISNALLLLASYLNNPKQPQYGIANQTQYETIKVEEKSPEVGPDTERTTSNSDNQDVKDDFKTAPDFTTPNIRYIVRSVPAKIYSETGKSLADYKIDPNRLIAQIIMYDSNSSPNFDRIIKAYEYGKVKGTNDTNQKIPTTNITPDEAKATFKRLAPSITYGAVNSVMRSVSVSTDINPVIAQQQIIEAGKAIFLNNVKADESSDVNEIKLFPGAVSISMLGLPIIERGQEIYLDLGTGTTLDSLYYVTSVKHELKPGDFTTSLSLVYKGQGSVSSLTSMIDNYNRTFDPPRQAEIKKTETPTSAPTTSSELPELGKTTGAVRTVGIT